jgi:uncharacterized protein HemX
MNEITPAPSPASLSPHRRATDVAPRGGRRRALLALLTIALLAGAGYLVLESRREARLQQELAQTRLREAGEAATRAQAAAAQAQEAQRKLADIERVAAEAAATPLPEVSSRDDVLLLEVERLVTLAAHELQLTRQTAAAMASLELADARLAVANSPRFSPLRRALARDLERLRAVPAVDVTGIALKLDQMIAGADVWPLANAPGAPPAQKGPRVAKKTEPVPEPPAQPPAGAWQRVREWLAIEFGDLVRIHEAGMPEALLLTDEQGKLIRSQLKLRLLGARLALLARNDRLYHSDVGSAQTLLALYFEGRHAGVAGAAATLRQINSAVLGLDVPPLAESPAALRAARARRP